MYVFIVYVKLNLFADFLCPYSGDKPSIISSEDIPGDLKDLDFIRHRRRDDDILKDERRRHTYETRERESDAERLRRISLESRNSPR